MTKVQLLLAGLCATSAFASPWNRFKKRGDDWDDGKHTGPGGFPHGYGTTETGWGYGTSSTCEASTVTEVQQSTVTLPRETQTLPGKLIVTFVSFGCR